MNRWTRTVLYRIVGTVVVVFVGSFLFVRFGSDGRSSQAADSGQETEQTNEKFHSRSTKNTVGMMNILVRVRDVSLSFSLVEKRTSRVHSFDTLHCTVT